MLVSTVRYLAITHFVVGALFFIFEIADSVTSVLGRDNMFLAGHWFFGVWTDVHCRWPRYFSQYSTENSKVRLLSPVNFKGAQRVSYNLCMCQAGVFMGFSITSAVLGGIIIIAYSRMIANASYFQYYHDYNYYHYGPYIDHRYSYDAKMGLAAVILALGIIEFCTGLWVSICLCVMKPCCTDLEECEPLITSTG